MATGLVWHERYMWHDTRHGAGPLPAGGWLEPDLHAENPATKRRLKNLLDATGLSDELVTIRPRPATVEELGRYHAPAYVERIRSLSANDGGDAGNRTPFGPGSFEIACLSAGGVIAAVDAVLDGDVENAYALVRPPGHHAESGSGGGFCIFSNIAIAVLHARKERGVERVGIVDWDVHHGNGTEDAFYGEPTVLTISLHEDGCFPPGSGPRERNGEGPGWGTNINVPLPAGSGEGAYDAALERVVVPALEAFAPELIVVGSGFDASYMDPLGHMMLHSGSYRAATRTILEAAARLCGGRVVMAHEGGYSAAYVPFCGLAVIEELLGMQAGVEDPFKALADRPEAQSLLAHQAGAVAAAASLVANVPQQPAVQRQ